MRMQGESDELEALHKALKGGDLAATKSLCCHMFSCTSQLIDKLITANLTEHEFYSACRILVEIRDSSDAERPTKSLALALVLSHSQDALNIAKEISRGLPIPAVDR
jgi:hypothetical protein